MRYHHEETDESPLLAPLSAEIAVRGAGRAQMRAIKDPTDDYGQDTPAPYRRIAAEDNQ